MSLVLPRPAPILISAPDGRSTLPIVELPRSAVQSRQRQIRFRRGSRQRESADCSFGKFSDHLDFDAWSLFHAAKKTELTTTFTTSMADYRALTFAGEYDGLFVWNTDNFRRVERSVFALEDFSETGLAGRFGEAIAYLAMVKWDYVYWDRIAVLWERAAAVSGMTHPERVRWAHVISERLDARRPHLEPDFAFEKANGEVALMEAKGSFVHPINDNPSTKADLRHGLKQLAAWTGMVAPAPSKSFAVGTYFRDVSDNAGDPSLIAFVDPPGSKTRSGPRVAFSPDWIRRGNYGAWLIGMGFANGGNALRSGRAVSLSDRLLRVVKIAGRDFALVAQGVRMKEIGKSLVPMPWFDPWSFDGIAAIQVLGIESDTLDLIEEAARNPTSHALLRRNANATLAQSESGDAPRPSVGFARSSTPGFSGSIMPDGTLMGEIDPEMFARAGVESFRLG